MQLFPNPEQKMRSVSVSNVSVLLRREKEERVIIGARRVEEMRQHRRSE